MKRSDYSTEAYRQGFIDGARRWDTKYPKELMIAGYNFDKILELILKDQEKESMKLCECKEWGLNGHECEFPKLNISNCRLRLKFKKENQMSDKIKVTLTRQAAADMLRRHTLEGHSNIDNMINFYVEAGMLEVVEEKALIVNHVDKGKLIIQRNGVTIYDETNPDEEREKFRQALADLGHSEATVYGHWALTAYDRAHNITH